MRPAFARLPLHGALLAVAVAAGLADARAQAPRLVVQAENDAFALGPKTDRWYTGGARLLAFADEAREDAGLVRRFAPVLLHLDGGGAPLRRAVSLTQLVYTPDDLDSP